MFGSSMALIYMTCSFGSFQLETETLLEGGACFEDTVNLQAKDDASEASRLGFCDDTESAAS